MLGHTLFFIMVVFSKADRLRRNFVERNASAIELFDLTHPTTWKDMAEFYGAIEKQWKICVKCGVPGLGTLIHLEHLPMAGSMRPAVIPTEYLLTRLVIIDVSFIIKAEPGLSLSLDTALQWGALREDPVEPTLLLFKFGWKRGSPNRQCVCSIPGLSYEVAEWISSKLSHVVGVATDAPTLESDRTRELTVRTVSNLLGRSGIYIIENVNLRKRLPEYGCMCIAMPLKLLEAGYAPTRLTAFCPARAHRHVFITAGRPSAAPAQPKRVYDVSLKEILD